MREEEDEVTTDVLAGYSIVAEEEEIFGYNTTSSPQLLPPECLAVLKNLTSDKETFDLTEALALGCSLFSAVNTFHLGHLISILFSGHSITAIFDNEVLFQTF